VESNLRFVLVEPFILLLLAMLAFEKEVKMVVFFQIKVKKVIYLNSEWLCLLPVVNASFRLPR